MEIKNNEKIIQLTNQIVELKQNSNWLDKRSKTYKQVAKKESEVKGIIYEIAKQRIIELELNHRFIHIETVYYNGIAKYYLKYKGHEFTEKEVEDIKQKIETEIIEQNIQKENFKKVIEMIGNENISYRNDYRKDYDGNKIEINFTDENNWLRDRLIIDFDGSRTDFSLCVNEGINVGKISRLVGKFKDLIAEFSDKTFEKQRG